MSGYDWDFEDDDEQPIDPRSLPKQLRDMLKATKKAEKEALDRVKTLETSNRELVVSRVLESKGVPVKVAQLIPPDVTSGEAIEKWLSDFSDVFTPSSSTSAATQAPTGEQASTTSQGQAFIDNAAVSSGLTPEEIANQQRMQNTAATSQPFGGKAEELLAKLNDPELTEEQFNALLKAG